MARKVIPLVNGERYHVYNRGVDKRKIFSSKNDYIRFYDSLDVFNVSNPTFNFEYAKSKERLDSDKLVQIHAYALVSNHFHLIVEQLTDGGVSEFMKRLQGGYTSYFNDRYDRSGTLLQGRFKRIHIDTQEYYQYLFVYVNENHYVHKVQRGDDVFYSSSPHYQKQSHSIILPEVENPYDYKEAQKLARSIAKQRDIIKTEL
ncbi:transposase [Candidatus Nomurabacteria bacterium]|nr:transposase [Candidatus Kaiserbacteria bacterium]MCB9814196.1 transposase [Candidatus Nomurabacteria bacterium]